MAVSCWLVPGAIDWLAGETVIETSVAELTAKVTEPSVPPRLAVIVLLPALAPVAKPAGEIPATLAFDEPQMAIPVKFCVLPSVNVPVAVNCSVVPVAICGFAGETAIEASVAAVTVSVVLP